jgi:hypothetical protein
MEIFWTEIIGMEWGRLEKTDTRYRLFYRKSALRPYHQKSVYNGLLPYRGGRNVQRHIDEEGTEEAEEEAVTGRSRQRQGVCLVGRLPCLTRI